VARKSIEQFEQGARTWQTTDRWWTTIRKNAFFAVTHMKAVWLQKLLQNNLIPQLNAEMQLHYLTTILIFQTHLFTMNKKIYTHS